MNEDELEEGEGPRTGDDAFDALDAEGKRAWWAAFWEARPHWPKERLPGATRHTNGTLTQEEAKAAGVEWNRYGARSMYAILDEDEDAEPALERSNAPEPKPRSGLHLLTSRPVRFKGRQGRHREYVLTKQEPETKSDDGPPALVEGEQENNMSSKKSETKADEAARIEKLRATILQRIGKDGISAVALAEELGIGVNAVHHQAQKLRKEGKLAPSPLGGKGTTKGKAKAAAKRKAKPAKKRTRNALVKLPKQGNVKITVKKGEPEVVDGFARGVIVGAVVDAFSDEAKNAESKIRNARMSVAMSSEVTAAIDVLRKELAVLDAEAGALRVTIGVLEGRV